VADSDKLVAAARDDHEKSDYQQAYEKYEKALNLLPDAPMTAERRANLKKLLGNAAVGIANKAVLEGRDDDSREWLNKAREWDPDNPQARQKIVEDFTSETAAAQDPYSTFSLNISDASFQVAQAAIAKGQRPDPAGIKVEQFYNAVDYGDPSPTAGEPVAVTIEQAAHPVIPGRNLVRVALKTAAAGHAASQPLRLTLLVDQSGSMVREDRRAAMDKALTGLAGLLTANDKVTVIGFARTPRLLADGWTGEQAAKLAELINQTANEGGTNLEEAIKLAEQLAERHKLAGAQNRIVLFTDGAANLGDADPEHLAAKVKALRQKGIAFDIAGIAADDLNDGLLGELARNGNGRYYVVGKGADENFARQLAGAFRPAAENVKVQVHFNPERVNRYKLIGFEKDRLKTEDFRNDAVDAAELAAEEAGVAIYQVEPVPGGTGELGDVSVRFRDTVGNRMVERKWTIPHDANAPAIDRAKPSMQLAVLAMFAAEKLRGGPLADAIDFKQLVAPRANVKQFYGKTGRVAEVLHMIDSL
jgi:Mg-chelatase subunit ChlD